MKIDLAGGKPTIDFVDLAVLLGVAPADVQEKMHSGEITSQFETGEGEDAGRFRLTFFYDAKRVRLTCDAEGTVLSTSRTPAPRRE